MLSLYRKIFFFSIGFNKKEHRISSVLWGCLENSADLVSADRTFSSVTKLIVSYFLGSQKEISSVELNFLKNWFKVFFFHNFLLINNTIGIITYRKLLVKKRKPCNKGCKVRKSAPLITETVIAISFAKTGRGGRVAGILIYGPGKKLRRGCKRK